MSDPAIKMKPPGEFFDAVATANISTITAFLENKNLDLDQLQGFGSKGVTPLILAVQSKNVKVVQLLVDYGCDLDKPGNFWGWVPLFYAVTTGEDKMVKLLLAAGAQIDKTDHSQRTALFVAVEAGLLSMVNILLDLGADPDKCSGFEPIPASVRDAINDPQASEADIKELTEPYVKNTALLKACWLGHQDIITELLNRAVDIKVCSMSGNTPLHIVAKQSHVEIVHQFLARHTSVNVINLCGDTPLHASVKKLFFGTYLHPAIWDEAVRLSGVVELLVKANADTTICDTNNHTALHTLLTRSFPGVNNTGFLNELRFRLIEMVLNSTLYAQRLPAKDTFAPELVANHSDLLEWLEGVVHSPRSLQQLSKYALHGYVGTDRSLYNHLHLPLILINSLCL